MCIMRPTLLQRITHKDGMVDGAIEVFLTFIRHSLKIISLY